MAHLALYRKYRPQSFEEVIGQDHIVKTLTSQVKKNNIGHAYLFCGTRGVGKTSIAKIFAKAINCLNPKDGSPCATCANCKDSFNSVDMLEIDAASNNSVEDIRALKEKIQYPPVNGKYKVYIIDEVHMLSTGAFNALLKTLEEPPEYAVFVLATTESHKIPATILSRCTKFDFRLVGVKELENLLTKIFKEENISYTPEAVNAIAIAGQGSVRDTLSIADMCASFSQNYITYETFLSCVGATEIETILQMIEFVKNSEIENIISLIDSLQNKGKNLTIIVKDILENVRNLLVIKKVKNYKEILLLPEHNLNLLGNLAKKLDEKELLYMLEKLSGIDNELRYALNLKLFIESVFISMAISVQKLQFENSFSNKNNNENNEEILNKIYEYIDKKFENLKVNLPQENIENSFNAILDNDTKNLRKNEKIDKNIEIIEKNLQNNQKNSNNLENSINSPEEDDNEDIDETSPSMNLDTKSKKQNFYESNPDKFYAEILRNCRERNWVHLLSGFNNVVNYEITQNTITFYVSSNSAKTILDYGKDDLDTIVKSINSEMSAQIKLVEKDNQSKQIEILKKKFGNNLKITN